MKSSDLHHSKLTFRKHKFSCTKINSRCGSFRLYYIDQSLLKQHSHSGSFRSSSTLGGFRNVVLKVSYDGYVIDVRCKRYFKTGLAYICFFLTLLGINNNDH